MTRPAATSYTACQPDSHDVRVSTMAHHAVAASVVQPASERRAMRSIWRANAMVVSMAEIMQ